MEQQISLTANKKSFSIDEFIEYLKEQKSKGATYVKFWVSNDPMWRYEWVETFRLKSEQEVKQEKINQLKADLSRLERE